LESIQDEDSPHHTRRPDFGDSLDTLDTILFDLRAIIGIMFLFLVGEIIDDMVLRLYLLLEVALDLGRASGSGHAFFLMRYLSSNDDQRAGNRVVKKVKKCHEWVTLG
jgi:hypothetical protein